MKYLPDGFVEKWKADGERTLFYGQAVSDMTRDELLAFIGWVGNDLRRDCDDQRKAWSFMREIQL